MEIREIKPTIFKQYTIKRVAVYARISVSKDKDDEHSLDQQVSYYEGLIQSKLDWTLVGVYVDEGVSGTRNDRPEFQRMMEDARKHQFDLLITKSITRFARNTLTLLNATRELKELGIDVWFEKEDIHSISPDGELLLTLLAMYAEEEARSASENVSWAIHKGFERGKHAFWRIYGYAVEGEKYAPIPEEAELIKRIYEEFLNGDSIYTIIKRLNDEHILRRGNRWCESAIKEILTNEKYTGNILLQKYRTVDFKTKKRVKNTGEWKQYYLENTHEAIIPKELYDSVQEELRKREERRPKYQRRNPEAELFRGLVFCGCCGRRLSMEYNYAKGEKKSPVYVCASRLGENGERCKSHRILKQILLQKTSEVLNIPEAEVRREGLDASIKRIINTENYELVFELKDGTIKTIGWKPTYGWTDERRKGASERAKRQWSPEHREAMSKCHKEHWTEEKRQEWGEVQKLCWTDERRRKTSEERKAFWTPERKKMESELTKERIWKKKQNKMQEK